MRPDIPASAPNSQMPTLPFSVEEALQVIQGLRNDPGADVMHLPPPVARRSPGFPSQGLPRPQAAQRDVQVTSPL